MQTEYRRYRKLIESLEIGTTQDELKSAGVQLAAAISRYHEDAHTVAERTNSEVQLTDEDARVLKACADLPAPAVRKAAMWFLCDTGPVDWDDVEGWIADPDVEVRETSCEAIAYGLNAIYCLCASDQDRCGRLFDAVFADNDRFSAMHVDCSCSVRFHGDRKDLEAAWRGTGLIIDLGRPYLTTPLAVGFLEDVMVHSDPPLHWNDPLVRSWIEGDSVQRKMALLAVVQWFGVQKPGQRELAKALSRDRSKVVSEYAMSLLTGKLMPDILAREWSD